jgi:uncharacterized protein (TIGR03067 family)
MRRSMPLLILVAVILTAGFAPPPARPTGADADLKKMQGTWVLADRVVSRRPGEVPWPVGEHRIVVEGNRLKYQSGGKVYDEYVLSLDPRRSPKWYTARSVRERDWVYHGIYSLEGGALKFCENGLRGSRPKAFDGLGEGIFLYVYKRHN